MEPKRRLVFLDRVFTSERVGVRVHVRIKYEIKRFHLAKIQRPIVSILYGTSVYGLPTKIIPSDSAKRPFLFYTLGISDTAKIMRLPGPCIP